MSNPLHGFTTISIAYSDSATHYIYARAHSGGSSDKRKANGLSNASESLPNGRTLFLVNVPPDATARELSLFFKYAGTVEKVVFGDESNVVEEDGWVDTDTEAEPEDVDMHSDDELRLKPAKALKRKRKEEKSKPPPQVPLPIQSLRTLRPSGRTAHVVFLDESSLTRAIQIPSGSKSKPDRRPWPTSDEPRGLARYLAMHNAARPPLDTVRAHAEAAIGRWDWEQEQARRASKYRKGEAIVDEDGFTLVTRGGAYGQTVGGGVGVASRQFQDEVAKNGVEGVAKAKRGKGRKKKESKNKEGFYAFQLHEKRRNNLIQLKRKWAEDQERIKELKTSKKFKPY